MNILPDSVGSIEPKSQLSNREIFGTIYGRYVREFAPHVDAKEITARLNAFAQGRPLTLAAKHACLCLGINEKVIVEYLNV